MSLESPWSSSVDELARELSVEVESGLTPDEAQRRYEEYGPNRVQQGRSRSAWNVLVSQFKSLIMLVLAIAAALSFAFGRWIDGIAVAIAMFINVGIGFFTELRAVRSMEALKRLDRITAKVRRDADVDEIDAERLVPGDVVEFGGGDIVPADIRLIEAARLFADESALTGESTTVSKQVDPVEKDAPLAERASMIFKGTALTRGSGTGMVVATGSRTEVGEVSTMVEEAEQKEDPLQIKLNRLARSLVWLIVIVAAAAGVVGVASGRDLLLMIQTTVALIVAAIPEGLAVVATMALARGVRRMARHNALVRRLNAVQTLGATNTILTDKTGTLTENRMHLRRLLIGSDEYQLSDDEAQPLDETSELGHALLLSVLCTNATVDPEDREEVGDPMEVALVRSGMEHGLSKPELLERYPEVREHAFDSSTMMMATVHSGESGLFAAIKGAPQAVLDAVGNLDESDRKAWQQKNAELASNGLRVLALAEKQLEDAEEEPYAKAHFVGLIGLLDPPREDVGEAISLCHRAGLRIVMVTGDQKETAVQVGEALGLDTAGSRPGGELESIEAGQEEELRNATVFYRVSPRQKLNLIQLHQDAGHVVAMTGDGVNDAPALKQADIGVAMGGRGEQVAKDASDVVLRDDAFSTITVAVEYGRIVFGNIRKFVLYLISGNMAEIAIVAVASLFGLPLPLLPLQILYLNAINDIFPALALGFGPGDERVMQRPPRDPDEPIMTRNNWLELAVYAAVLAAFVLAGFVFVRSVLGLPEREAVTVSFFSLAFGRLWHIWNMRDAGSPVFNNTIFRNGYVWGAILLCSVLILLAVTVSPISVVLDVRFPPAAGWLVILAASLVPTLLIQAVRWALRR